MSKASFAYTIYVHGTPDDVWRGLLEPEYTRRYWFHEQVSDWKPGSPWEHRRTDEEGTVDVAGTVVEFDRPSKLVLTWAKPEDLDDPDLVSTVTFELAGVDEWPHGPWTAVSLVHSELDPDGDMLPSISFGWPAVLSGLKSVLESPEIFEES